MENMQEKMEQIAMEIILAAGDARIEANKALDAAEGFDFATAEQCLQEARKNIVKAHNAQTIPCRRKLRLRRVSRPASCLTMRRIR